MTSFLSSLAFAFPTSAEILEAIPVILSLIIIEGLLSVDNALAIAALAKHLPRREKFKALRYGIIGAYVFRGICMWGVAWIIANQWVKILGAAYLIHLMASHFSSQQEKDDNPGAEGEGVQRGFWATILAIEFMDLTLSVDNVVAAVAISPKLWVVCTGVFIGILALRFLAGYCIRLIEKFPVLENTAFLLIGYVGVLLLAELTFHFQLGTLGKFIGICIILGLSILYGEKETLRRISSPLIKVAQLFMKIYSAITGAIINVICAPFRFLIGSLRAKA